jgi:hypothetical protein
VSSSVPFFLTGPQVELLAAFGPDAVLPDSTLVRRTLIALACKGLLERLPGGYSLTPLGQAAARLALLLRS